MSKTYTITFKVRARQGSPFPFDMLRYDRCYPRSERVTVTDTGWLNEGT